uniref:Uncharacterized protein n=1 Tax=Globodera pallida TaxID=36090 RepID=A0A183CJB0_GLOPA
MIVHPNSNKGGAPLSQGHRLEHSCFCERHGQSKWLPILLETYAGPGWLGRMLAGLSSSNPESGTSTELRRINKPARKRLRPASTAHGGTVALATSLALITAFSLVPLSNAATVPPHILEQNPETE